jgi:hypothetical protein
MCDWWLAYWQRVLEDPSLVKLERSWDNVFFLKKQFSYAETIICVTKILAYKLYITLCFSLIYYIHTFKLPNLDHSKTDYLAAFKVSSARPSSFTSSSKFTISSRSGTNLH